jgi:hypothetical protein
MPTRRVVTGEVGGKAVFTIDETVDDIHIGLMPGAAIARVYGNNHLALPNDGRENDTYNYFPEPGGAAVYMITLPPDTKAPSEKPQDLAPLIAEAKAKLPGMLEAMSNDGSFTHRTDTIDVVTILAGRIVIELAGGSSKEIGAGTSSSRTARAIAGAIPMARRAPCTRCRSASRALQASLARIASVMSSY